MPSCDNCGCKLAEYKVYSNDVKLTGHNVSESPLYVISCYDCLPGYETQKSTTVQVFFGPKRLQKKSEIVIKQSKFL